MNKTNAYNWFAFEYKVLNDANIIIGNNKVVNSNMVKLNPSTTNDKEIFGLEIHCCTNEILFPFIKSTAKINAITALIKLVTKAILAAFLEFDATVATAPKI